MTSIMGIPLAQLDYYALMMIRVSGLLISSPIFGRRNVPNMVKISFCLALTYLFGSVYPPPAQVLPYQDIFGFAVLCILEALFGMSLGYLTTLFFGVTFTAGQIIDMQSGFGMVNVLDPQSNTQVPVSGNLLNLLLLICFFAVDGHLSLVQIIFGTIARVPVGYVQLNTQLGVAALQSFSKAFVLAIQLAIPVIASGILMEAVLGIMIRTVPQMNMYVVGIPLKVLVGFIMLFLIMPIFANFSQSIFEQMYLAIDQMMEGLVPIP